MAASGDRSQYFAAIEKKHGAPIAHWIDLLGELGNATYPAQIAFLRENFGFSQTHANALVMYVRGSTTAKRYETPADYFASIDPVAAATARAIFAVIQQEFPQLELVIAWNQPILRVGKRSVFGLSVAKNHITINPFSAEVLTLCADGIAAYAVKKRTFAVPVDWHVDPLLLKDLVAARLAEFE